MNGCGYLRESMRRMENKMWRDSGKAKSNQDPATGTVSLGHAQWYQGQQALIVTTLHQ